MRLETESLHRRKLPSKARLRRGRKGSGSIVKDGNLHFYNYAPASCSPMSPCLSQWSGLKVLAEPSLDFAAFRLTRLMKN